MELVTAKELADAIGYEAVAFRAVLRRYRDEGVGPAIDPGRGNWAFTAADVATFAVTRALARAGIAIVEAFNVAKQALGRLYGSDAGASDIVRQLRGKHLEVTYDAPPRVVTKRRALPVVLYIDLAAVISQAFRQLSQVVEHELPPLYYVADTPKVPRK